MESLDATISSNSSSSSYSSSGGVNNNDNSSISNDNNVNSISNGNSSAGTVTWYGMRLPSVSPLRSPLSFLLDYSGILRSNHDSEGLIVNEGVTSSELRSQPRIQSLDDAAGAAAASGAPCNSATGEVAIRIIGAGEHEHNVGLGSVPSSSRNQIGEVGYDDCDEVIGDRGGMPALGDDAGGIAVGERVPLVSSSSSSSLAGGSGQAEGDAGNGGESNSRDSSSYQRYDIQQIAKWIEQILPFSLLLLVVFIRQHLQGITTSVLTNTLVMLCL